MRTTVLCAVLPLSITTSARAQTARIADSLLDRGRLTLRVSGFLEQEPPATAIVLVTLAKPSDSLVLQANGWVSMREPDVARLLREHRWTLDAKHGQLIVE